MEPDNAQAAMADLEEAVKELGTELDRLTQNIDAVTEYQSSVLRVSKVLCAWMENIEALAKHRKKLQPSPSSTY
ncbi:Hypothetical predicted protein [Pelobates cultripes]|uniref:Uncharacterized protein n=1 Tax=Pelobates cultripes TaxID=61616 RepID=A0AAD1TP79_PELCU|nr:Hypothetical predicted protein [Pelobates cultripes]